MGELAVTDSMKFVRSEYESLESTPMRHLTEISGLGVEGGREDTALDMEDTHSDTRVGDSISRAPKQPFKETLSLGQPQFRFIPFQNPDQD